jgi:hypothetical protein
VADSFPKTKRISAGLLRGRQREDIRTCLVAMQRYEKPMGAVSSLATARPLVNFLISPAIKSNG